MLLGEWTQLEAAADLGRHRKQELHRAMRSARHVLERLPDVMVSELLDPRELKVLRLRLGLEDGRKYTQAEIGMELNVGRERVRQIQSVALKKLGVKGGRRI